jgi:hypothetical protein
MAPANTYPNDEYLNQGTVNISEDRGGGMDFSHDSDDSSDRARYHHHFSTVEDLFVDYDSHGVKRGGNNHFGSTGILKCLTCRKRKGKVLRSLSRRLLTCSANIMINMKLVDSAPIDLCNVGRSSLQRARGPMNCLNNCFPYKEKLVWYHFLM